MFVLQLHYHGKRYERNGDNVLNDNENAREDGFRLAALLAFYDGYRIVTQRDSSRNGARHESDYQRKRNVERNVGWREGNVEPDFARRISVEDWHKRLGKHCGQHNARAGKQHCLNNISAEDRAALLAQSQAYGHLLGPFACERHAQIYVVEKRRHQQKDSDGYQHVNHCQIAPLDSVAAVSRRKIDFFERHCQPKIGIPPTLLAPSQFAPHNGVNQRSDGLVVGAFAKAD